MHFGNKTKWPSVGDIYKSGNIFRISNLESMQTDPVNMPFRNEGFLFYKYYSIIKPLKRYPAIPKRYPGKLYSQIYAKVMEVKLSRDMDGLRKALAKRTNG